MRSRPLILLLLLALLTTGCSETRYVAEGSYLLNRVRVKCDQKADGINPGEMKDLVKQRGNARWLSTMKIPLFIYSMAGKDTTKWLNRSLHAMGEAPVIYDSTQTQHSIQNLLLHMQSQGYLRATVDVQNTVKGRKLNTTYILHPGAPYHVRRLAYDIQDSAIASLLNRDDSVQRLLRPGMRLNIEQLDNERKRITRRLNDAGYYRFNKDFISYLADSVSGTTDVDLTLVLHRYRNNQVADEPHRQYFMDTIRYRSGNPDDSIIHLRPSVLRSNTFLYARQPFSAQGLQDTYSHFGRLGAVRYTNINFREHPDTTLLDCDIAVSTNKPSTISFQPEGTNTAGDLGAAVSLTYQNRNLFHGAEKLTIQLRGAFEAIRGLEGYSNSNFVEYSAETSLSFPRFIAPFLSSSFRRRTNATSEVSVKYDLQNRPEFRRRVFSVGWKYKWNDPNHHDRYQLDVVDLHFITMPWVSGKFFDDYLSDISSRNAILLYNYQDLFIMRWGLGYSYNNGRYAIKAKIETAGNLLSLASHTLKFHKNEEDQYTFLDVAYAQYVKGDIDFTRNFQLTYGSQIVFHAGFGIAYPYGNSTVLPFEKRYFSGGANSVRGWSVRQLGPGSYVSEDGNIDFINQTGDMKLDLNVEYRAHLFWKFGAALFVDAGNIWTLRNYEEQPGGQFRLSKFWQQLAVGYGLGLRLNFDYFILRFDMGMKAVNPAYDDAHEHFPIIHPRLSRDFTFHFAVGLPF